MKQNDANIRYAGQLESLVGKTTEENGIAWIKAFTCTHHQSYVYDAPFNDQTGFIEYATSIKLNVILK